MKTCKIPNCDEKKDPKNHAFCIEHFRDYKRYSAAKRLKDFYVKYNYFVPKKKTKPKITNTKEDKRAIYVNGVEFKRCAITYEVIERLGKLEHKDRVEYSVRTKKTLASELELEE